MSTTTISRWAFAWHGPSPSTDRSSSEDLASVVALGVSEKWLDSPEGRVGDVQ
jgi:hypothetical protein